MPIDLTILPNPAATGDVVVLRAALMRDGVRVADPINYRWEFTGGMMRDFQPIPGADNRPDVRWDTTGLRPSNYSVRVTAMRDGAGAVEAEEGDVVLTQSLSAVTTTTTLQRTSGDPTPDIGLWMAIRRNARNLSFQSYDQTIASMLTQGLPGADARRIANDPRDAAIIGRRFSLLSDTDAYRFLKVATEAFLIANTGEALGNPGYFTQQDVNEAARRLNRRGANIDVDLLRAYLQPVQRDDQPGGGVANTLPYLAVVRRKLDDVGLRGRLGGGAGAGDELDGIFEARLTAPLLIELIWSYWHEEGMLVQSMNAISRRFQNIRGPEDRDPLTGFETNPLRPLNNMLWGYIQDEQHRLTVARRVYEYDHHYGITLHGKSVPQIRSADSRSQFLEAFHNLLYLCTLFFPQDDDTTVIADGFPVLNALREVHLLLTQGAHNQYGDLPSTARQEMLLQQWLLARPEFREFLPTRVMVAYPEAWMDRVDAMKQLQGWTNTSVLHFHHLGDFGEQILLGVRFGNWNGVNDPLQAANWARFWRPEIQGYIHAYRAVTGVDLSAELTDSRKASERYLQPAVHLTRQLATQRRSSLPAPAQDMAPTPPRRRLPGR